MILETAVTDQRGMARSAAGPHEQILDGPLQDVIGREADRVPHPPSFQRLVDGWQGKRRVGSDDDGLLLVSEPVNDRKEHLLPPLGTGDVSRAKRGGQAVAVLIASNRRLRQTAMGSFSWCCSSSVRCESSSALPPGRIGLPSATIFSRSHLAVARESS